MALDYPQKSTTRHRQGLHYSDFCTIRRARSQRTQPVTLRDNPKSKTNPLSSAKGTLYLTATPLLGVTKLVRKFIEGEDTDCGLVTMGLEDAGHFIPAERLQIERSYPEHERRCRAEGVPFLGSGLVYPVADSAISIEPFPIPAYWPRLAAIDLGVEHATAVVFSAWNRDADIVVTYDIHYLKDAGAAVHAGAILQRGRSIPCVYPHDALARENSSGDNVANLYKSFGVNMVGRASFEDGTASVEAGVAVVLDRFTSGRLKIFSHLRPLFDELHLYHRKNGKIVSVFDDALSALRYNIISLRHGRTADESGQHRRGPVQAEGVDQSPFDDDSPSVSRGNRNARGEYVVWSNGRPPSLQRR